MASFTLTLSSIASVHPSRGNLLLFSSCTSRFPSLAPLTVKLRPHGSLIRVAASDPERSREGRSLQLVQELRVPQAWSTPSIALEESEWLRETLHKWLDEEYCPEPTNTEISKVAAKSYYESLISNETELGEILLKMVANLETLSYRESFHGPFSSANAAVRLITQRMDSISDK